MLLLNNTLGGRGGAELGLGGGGVFDEYSRAVSVEIVVNHLFFRLLGFVISAGGHNGPSCAAHLLGSRCGG